MPTKESREVFPGMEYLGYRVPGVLGISPGSLSYWYLRYWVPEALDSIGLEGLRRTHAVRRFGPGQATGAHQWAGHETPAGLGRPLGHTPLVGEGVGGLVFCVVNKISDAVRRTVRVPCKYSPYGS